MYRNFCLFSRFTSRHSDTKSLCGALKASFFSLSACVSCNICNLGCDNESKQCGAAGCAAVGQWGLDCTQRCDAKCLNGCAYYSGACNSCKAGFFGYDCSQRCPAQCATNCGSVYGGCVTGCASFSTCGSCQSDSSCQWCSATWCFGVVMNPFVSTNGVCIAC